ncbi:uncharacterized protein [Cherax quadricarinatus]|uniref:uncharacterized protein isoform X2 n=1 Tax=Cherax quadricarinatus TaxID=27406 RepID=UPI00387E9DC8
MMDSISSFTITVSQDSISSFTITVSQDSTSSFTITVSQDSTSSFTITVSQDSSVSPTFTDYQDFISSLTVSDYMDDSKPEECKVCFINYDEELHRPRTLPCGHTFCSQCIKDTIKNGQLKCPSCRVVHSATAATQFPISYGMEALLKKFRNMQVTSVGPESPKSGQDHTRGIGKKLQSVVQEQKSSISNLIRKCDAVLSQLGKYQGQVRDWKTQHHQLQNKLYDLVEQNKVALELLKQEDTSVVNMTTEGGAGKKQLQTMLDCLDTVTTIQEVDTTCDEADQYSVQAEDWIQKCQELFPNFIIAGTSVKLQENIKKALDMMTRETVTTDVPVLLEDSGSTVMEKVEKITGDIHLKLTVDHLRGMSKAVKRLVEAGLVLGVHQNQDDLRYSRITLQDGQLYLHVLQHQPPPPTHAHTIQVMEVMEEMELSSSRVFLDLTWPGSTRGRLHIQLNTNNTSLARQFMLLCTGQHPSGSSFLNTKLLEVMEKGEPGECVRGGDYQHNDGRGGRSLLSHQNYQRQESGSAGAVWSWSEPWSSYSAQFVISTRERTGRGKWPYVFGEVVSGLDVVRAAVNHSDITEVTVVDCGVVLAL